MNLEANQLVNELGHKLLQFYGVHKDTIEAREKGFFDLRWCESDSGEAEVVEAKGEMERPKRSLALSFSEVLNSAHANQ